MFLLAGAAPVPLLIFAGAFNGLILPVGVGVMLWVALRRPDLLGGYRYPRGLVALGVAGWLAHDLPRLAIARQPRAAVRVRLPGTAGVRAWTIDPIGD